MKSVLYVTTTFPTLAAFIENEVLRLVERGVRIRVLTLRSVSRNYQPRYAPLVERTMSVGNPLDPRGWLALLGWLARRPHVLVPEMARILWASRSSLYALVGHVGYLPAAARIASIAEREDFERIHGVWAHFPATAAYLAARLTGRRFSMSGHAGSDLHRTRAFLAEKARAADFVNCCVRQNAEMLSTLAGPPARVEWIYHGTDLSRFDGAGRHRAPEPTLAIVGRLAATKGFEDAVLALGELKRRGVEAKLSVVGDGPLRPTLEHLAREQGVEDRITFHGALSHEELLPVYRRAWLLVAPCRVLANGRQDGIPNVVVEAMAMKLPCVGTRIPGLEEAIVSGQTGAICEGGDPVVLAQAIESLLAAPAELERMGEAARTRALERFDFDRNFERLWSLFTGETDQRDRAAVNG